MIKLANNTSRHLSKQLITLLVGLALMSFKHKETTQILPETKVILETSLGKIKLKLYNETPKHRDNFIKLVNDHFYDGTLFHRVIESFMIQGGDPESKHAITGAVLGNGEIGYTLPAEFNSNLFHKKGVLAAARLSDDVNPQKESSGCQFYIVQGKVFTDSLLYFQAQRINNNNKQVIFRNLISKPENASEKERCIHFQQSGQTDSLKKIFDTFQPQIEAEYVKTPPFTFSEAQQKAYTTIGGTPHLDGSYTVYGEVIEGIEVVNSIASVAVDGTARPIDDVKIIKAYIVKK